MRAASERPKRLGVPEMWQGLRAVCSAMYFVPANRRDQARRESGTRKTKDYSPMTPTPEPTCETERAAVVACETCRWKSDSPYVNPDRGTAEFHDIMFACKRRAPVVTGGLHCPTMTIWPMVTRRDWCGEYSSNRAPSDLAQAVLADLAAGHSLRKTAMRQGTTLAVVRGIQKREHHERTGNDG